MSENNEWRPIETAPVAELEFVEVVLLCRSTSKGGAVMPAIWDGEKWQSFSLVGMIPYVEPTHWMPLPPPPATQGDQ